MAHRAEPAPDIFGLGDYTSLEEEEASDDPPGDVLDHLRSRR